MNMATEQELLAKCREALELADGIMSYCPGDAWERECTEKARNRFYELKCEICPPEPPLNMSSGYRDERDRQRREARRAKRRRRAQRKAEARAKEAARLAKTGGVN
jgi:hypothetical protein